jgi:predicted metallopeptidase
VRDLFEKLIPKLYDSEIRNEDLEKAKNIVSDFYKIPKTALDNVKVKTSYLPTIYACIVRRVGDYLQIIYKPIGKILGLYNPLKKEIYIDKNLSYPQRIKTILHEYIHAAQDYLGKLYTKSRKELEEEAYKVSDYLSKIYNQAFRKSPSFSSYQALI